MKKKIILASAIFVLFLMGITSSGLLPYFGQITWQITILPSEEPERNVPETMDDCKDNGWEKLIALSGRIFKNQGDCISYVQTSMCEDFGLLYGYLDDFDSYGSCVSYFASKGNSSGKEEGTSGENGGSGSSNSSLPNEPSQENINENNNETIENNLSNNETIEDEAQEENKTTEIVSEATSEPQTEQTSETNSQNNENNI